MPSIESAVSRVVVNVSDQLSPRLADQAKLPQSSATTANRPTVEQTVVDRLATHITRGEVGALLRGEISVLEPDPEPQPPLPQPH